MTAPGRVTSVLLFARPLDYGTLCLLAITTLRLWVCRATGHAIWILIAFPTCEYSDINKPFGAAVSEGDFATSPTLVGHSIDYESYEDVSPTEIEHISIEETEQGDRITVANFRPGSVMVFKVGLANTHRCMHAC